MLSDRGILQPLAAVYRSAVLGRQLVDQPVVDQGPQDAVQRLLGHAQHIQKRGHGQARIAVDEVHGAVVGAAQALRRQPLVVGHGYHRRPSFPRQPGEDVEDRLGALGIQVARRLVGQDDRSGG